MKTHLVHPSLANAIDKVSAPDPLSKLMGLPVVFSPAVPEDSILEVCPPDFSIHLNSHQFKYIPPRQPKGLSRKDKWAYRRRRLQHLRELKAMRRDGRLKDACNQIHRQAEAALFGENYG